MLILSQAFVFQIHSKGMGSIKNILHNRVDVPKCRLCDGGVVTIKK